MTVNEGAALHLLRNGDIAGLEALVSLYGEQARRTAYGIIGDLGLAEDVASDAFLAVYERIDRYDPARPFRPWFLRIVVNRALNVVSARKRVRTGEAAMASMNNQPDPDRSPETLAVLDADRDDIIAALATLPTGQRAAIVLRFYLDLDEKAIARVLGVPTGTVKWRLHVGRRRLKQVLLPRDAELRVVNDGESSQ